MMYFITSVTSVTMLSSFSTTFVTMKKCNRVVFQSLRSGKVHHNGAQCCIRDLLFFTLFHPFKKSNKNICYNSRLCTKGGMVTIVTSAKYTRPSHIATMSLEVHTTFCVQIGGKSRVACECVDSRGQSSFVQYEHFAH